MIQPLISVIVPIYNVETYLLQCVQSIIEQTYKNLEIILVDDGSPDNCPEFCDELQKKDSRIRVIHKKNGGLSSARNAGLEIANGAYISFIDSDDFIDHQMYQSMLECLIENNADIVSCGRNIYAGNKIDRVLYSDRASYSPEEAFTEILVGGNLNEAVWDKLYKSSLFAGIEFPNGEINEDIVIYPKILSRSNKIVNIGESYYFYRSNPQGISKSRYSRSRSVVIKHFDQVRKDTIAIWPELADDVNIFEARYSAEALKLFASDKTSKAKYSKDYCEYKTRLKRDLRSFYSSKRVSLSDKIKAYLLLTGQFGFFSKLKHLI